MTPFSRIPLLPLLACAAAVLSTAACATSPTRLDAVPKALSADAHVVGFPVVVRYFPRDASHVEEFKKDYLDSLDREEAWLKSQGSTGELPPASYLALSGGGDDGAFGAGLLNGWTNNGTRPVFKIVTGVSTGALIAPFAFLGPAYDETLKSLYTTVSLKDIAEKRSLLSAVYGDAVADTTPLRRLVEKYISKNVVDAIAAEHRKGRILLVGTTNLDVRRGVIWNLTKIAGSGSPAALDLVRKILIASAAIPGTFPPVMIDVEVNGKTYQEMHVDGGTVAQVFVYPAAIKLHELYERRRTLYVIRNARLDPDWSQVDRRILPIALRSITCLIQNQGEGDLYRIFAVAQRDHVEYKLAFIPRTFDVPHTTDFDTNYMKALFEVGYRMAGKGYDWWYRRPPVLVSGVDQNEETD